MISISGWLNNNLTISTLPWSTAICSADLFIKQINIKFYNKCIFETIYIILIFKILKEMMIMECHLLKQSKEEMILKKYFGVEFHKNKK